MVRHQAWSDTRHIARHRFTGAGTCQLVGPFQEVDRHGDRKRKRKRRHQATLTSMARQTRKTREKRVAGGSATSCGWQRDMGSMQHVAMWGS